MRSAIHISATIDKELYKRVDELSVEEERSKSWLVSKALKSYIDEIEDIKIAYQRMTSPEKRLISSKELRKSLNV